VGLAGTDWTDVQQPPIDPGVLVHELPRPAPRHRQRRPLARVLGPYLEGVDRAMQVALGDAGEAKETAACDNATAGTADCHVTAPTRLDHPTGPVALLACVLLVVRHAWILAWILRRELAAKAEALASGPETGRPANAEVVQRVDFAT
jgi:hypothetical protein